MSNEINERRLQLYETVNVEEVLTELVSSRWRDTFDEIVRAVKEHNAEQLERRKKMSNEENKRRLQLPNEVNVEELLAELEAYRWRDKKALILDGLGGGVFMGGIYREEKIKAYKEQKWVTLMKACYINEEVDILMLQGYAFDEIVRAIKEHIAEQLAEEL